ncbi:MAG: hypothetical protein FJY10_09380 [Bacteroidetes bacterium]|nr:hypothetical protein [Bacteroidota bacterium]
MNNDRVLQRILENFPSEHPSKSYIKLPSDIKFVPNGNEVEMIISKEAVRKNMQEDKASFEGWALVMKRWGGFDKVILNWDHQSFGKTKPEYGHYQRFLFRVKKFSCYFKSWFFVKPNGLPYQKSLLINDVSIYYLNRPSKDRCGDTEPQGEEGKESWLENKFVCDEWSEYLKNEVQAEFLDRQLPVGVFKDPGVTIKKKVSKENAIFARGKSAIDIWGISKANELLIFELKAEGNNKVGIITELYFYCCVMNRVQKGQFRYEKFDIPNIERIAKTKKIKAYFLAPALHPLIDKALVDLLNAGSAPDVEFHYISFANGIGNSLKVEY